MTSTQRAERSDRRHARAESSINHDHMEGRKKMKLKKLNEVEYSRLITGCYTQRHWPRARDVAIPISRFKNKKSGK